MRGTSGADRPTAFVLGDLDLVRALGLAGIRCVVVAEPGATVRFSRFIDHVITWDGDWADGSDLASELVRLAHAQQEQPILFYQHDEQALFVSRHRERLGTALRFIIADAQQLEGIVDKVRFHEHAQRLDVLVPDTRIIDPLSAPPEDLRFPVVLKPRTRADPRWASVEAHAKAVRLDGPDDLRKLWPRLAAVGDKLIAQEIIAGPEDRICSYHVYIASDGVIAGEFTGRKIRTLPREFGHTTSLVVTDAPDVLELGRRVIRSLNLRGVAKVDFKRGPDGRLWLLEVNPRFNLWHHIGALAGVNLPALVWADLSGHARPPVSAPRVGTRWCSINDFGAARAWGVSFPRWALWVLRCEAKANLALDDPMPVILRALWLLQHRNQNRREPSARRVAVRGRGIESRIDL